jgi:hypothetical protein
VIAAVLAFPHIAFSQASVEPGFAFPQAEPVLQMLRAVEAGDRELLIDSFTVKAKADLLLKYGKEEMLDIHRQLFTILRLYPFKTEDFTFTYSPIDGISGRILYYHKGEKVKDTGSRV